MTSDEVKEAMRLRWRNETGFLLAFEVSDRAGLDGKRRLDAVAFGFWPGKHGLQLHAFEIKVSRGDLLRELKQPEKAQQAARHCDTFSLVVPEDVPVDPKEIPKEWGLYRVGRVHERSLQVLEQIFWGAGGRMPDPPPMFPNTVRRPDFLPGAAKVPKRRYDPEIMGIRADYEPMDRSFMAAVAAAVARGRT